MAVVPAFEFDDLASARVGARQPERGHRRLRPGVHESQQLNPRKRFLDDARQFDLQLAGRPVGRPAGGSRRENVGHGRVRVPQDKRPVGAHVIDVVVPVDIDQP